MKIVITGANSFLGKRLAAKLSETGCELVLVMRPGHDKSIYGSNIKIVLLGMEEYGQLGKLAGSCDCFVHLAWDGTRGSSRMDRVRQQKNIEYSIQAVCSMLQSGCKRIVTAGSQAEYGPHHEKISEDSICSPNTEYGKAKLDFYQKLAGMCVQEGISYKEPRFFSLYGPGDYADTMVMSILRDMLAGRPCKLTQGIQMWDFLHVDDAVKGVVQLCIAPCPDGIYNFGSGDVRPLRKYVEEMAQITKTESPLLFGRIPYPETGMVSLWPDISKLHNELNWQPEILFNDGIQSILADIQI